MKEVIARYGPSKSILGNLSGHQGIAKYMVRNFITFPRCCTVVTSMTSITDKAEKLFNRVSETFQCTIIIRGPLLPETVKGDLIMTATNGEGLVWAFAM